MVPGLSQSRRSCCERLGPVAMRRDGRLNRNETHGPRDPVENDHCHHDSTSPGPPPSDCPGSHWQPDSEPGGSVAISRVESLPGATQLNGPGCSSSNERLVTRTQPRRSGIHDPGRPLASHSAGGGTPLLRLGVGVGVPVTITVPVTRDRDRHWHCDGAASAVPKRRSQAARPPPGPGGRCGTRSGGTTPGWALSR